MSESVVGMGSGLLFVAGCLFFPGSLVVLQHVWFDTAYGSMLRKKFGFSRKDCTDISVKIVSGIQAILASIAGVVVCSSCYKNVLYDSHPLTLIYAWFGIPYFIYDTFAMFYASRMSCKSKKEGFIVVDFFNFIFRSPIIVIHHLILAPIGFALTAFCRDGIRNGDFFMGIVYMMEISTPFVSLRFILSKFKLKSSLMYTINGLAMLISFPIFRIASTFYAVHLYAGQNQMGFFEALWNIPMGWKFVFLAAIAPQVYWYSLMWNGLIKMIRTPKKLNNAKLNGVDSGVFLNTENAKKD